MDGQHSEHRDRQLSRRTPRDYHDHGPTPGQSAIPCVGRPKTRYRHYSDKESVSWLMSSRTIDMRPPPRSPTSMPPSMPGPKHHSGQSATLRNCHRKVGPSVTVGSGVLAAMHTTSLATCKLVRGFELERRPGYLVAPLPTMHGQLMVFTTRRIDASRRWTVSTANSATDS